MGHRLLLFALASVLMMGCTTPAVDASLCLNTTCSEDNGYFALPLESPLHPDRPSNGVGTCTPCTLPTCTGNCTRCCYRRTCADYDGLGTTYCPYGFNSTAGGLGDVTVTSGDNSAARFSKCCTATTPNSFPAPSATIAGGVQAIAASQTNWGFLEDTDTYPFVSYNGRLTGMCFKVTANRSCDVSANPECCDAAAKPAFLQFKLPVPAALGALGGAAADSSPRYQALSQLSRCGLWFGRPNGRAAQRARWRFTNQDAADGEAAGTAEGDARYMSLSLSFGVAGEARMCVYVADVIEDRDCSWENICGLKVSDTVGFVGDAASGIVTPASPKRRLGCEVRLVGAPAGRLGNTVTSQCVGLTHTVTGFSSVKRYCGWWNNPCGNNSVCNDTRDGFTCGCAAGYESTTDNGRNCVDVDECSAAVNLCGSNTLCNNTDGSYTCTCKTGYMSPTNNSRDCVAACFCYNGGTCDVVGVCNCPSGYTGNICQTTATSSGRRDGHATGDDTMPDSTSSVMPEAGSVETVTVTTQSPANPWSRRSV